MKASARSLAILVLALGPMAVQAEMPLDGPLVGIWMMGQSLCDGSESLPIVTPADTGWGNYAFARGVRTWIAGSFNAAPEQRPEQEFVLVPLTAKQNGGLGETMANGLADHLSATAVAKGSAPHFLVAYAGQGGRTIAELSSANESTDPRTPEVKRGEGGFYKASLDDARRAVRQAKARGEAFRIAALVWMQGEANGGPHGGIVPSRWAEELPRPRGQEWYRDRLRAYRQQWSDDLRAITGQAGEIPMFTYQTMGPAGLAQLWAADADPAIYLVGPHYAMPSALNSRTTQGRYGASIHLAADTERWYGEQVAKVMRRVFSQGAAWEPLRPKRAWLEEGRRAVLVELTVPRPPLVLDHEWIPRQELALDVGYRSLDGFELRTSAGGLLGISAVKIAGANEVRIELAQPLAAGLETRLNYVIPYCGTLGQIVEVRAGVANGPQPTTELRLAGAWPERLKALLDEGTFLVGNMLGDQRYAQATIRWVREENGAAVLRFENRELRNAVDFAVGQTLTASRPYAYGNLRDSDPEKAIYRFGDAEYGRRAGQAYPLWNWCISFDEFPISAK